MTAQILRPYQLDMIERLQGQVRAGHRIIVAQAPTGSGKTTIAAEIARRAMARGRRTLFLVHRRKLVDQISDRLRGHGVLHGVLMRGEHWHSAHSTQVASRDTLLSRCVRNEWIGMPLADLVIVDEAHHAADPASEYRKILSAYPSAVVLLLTATPVGPDGAGLGPWATAIEAAAPTSQLVRDGFLAPVKIYWPNKDNVENVMCGELVENWRRHAQHKPTILFCGRVQHSKMAVEEFEANNLRAAHVDASTPDDERDEIFGRLASGQLNVVSNVGIVGEGVDVPEIGCVYIRRSVSGRVGWMQMIGRCMRPAPGKEHGIVIDPTGAVGKFGYPDEDFTWTLEGNQDQEWKKKKDAGEADAVNYCKRCELVYPRGQRCPQCGSAQTKPPKSVFSPAPICDPECQLSEASRAAVEKIWSIEEQRRHWARCQAIGAKRGGGDRQAAAIWRKKYGRYPTSEVTRSNHAAVSASTH